MKSGRILVAVAVAALLASSVIGCGKPQDIVVGFVGPLTGNASFLGQTGIKAVQLVVDEVNKAGGVNGRKIKLVQYDDQATPAEGVTAANKLIDQDKTVAIIGPYNSTVALAMMGTTEKKEVPFVTTACASKICNSGARYVFRATLDNEMQGVGFATYVADVLGLKKVAILYPNDDFGIELKDHFVKTAEPKGVQIVSAQGYNGGTTDFYGVLSGIKPLEPDGVLLCGLLEEGSQIMRQAKELGLKTQFLGYGGFADDSLQKLAGDACEGMLMVSLFEPGSPINQPGKDLVGKYKARYNEEANSYSGESYGSALILVDALKRAKSLDGPGVREALAATKLDVPLGNSLNFDARGQCVVRVTVAQIKGGKRVLADKQLK